MASEPYCAEAPSRSTSTRFRAMAGIAPTSGPCAPLARPLPKNVIAAARCRRLPLTSTSVWSGDRPRRFAGRTRVAAELIGWALTLYDGISARSMSVVSRRPWPAKSRGERMSSGASVSPPARCARREPVTRISSTASAAASAPAAGGGPPASASARQAPSPGAAPASA